MAEIKLTLYEKETIINYNEGEEQARVYTCSNPLIKKLQMLTEEFPDTFILEEKDDYSVTVLCPKNLISIRKPINLSDSVREQRRERMRRARAIQLQKKEEEK